MTPGIEAHGLTRVFKGDHRAVDGLDLRVEPGEIYAFLGPNGAGKSTTVLMLTTLLEPTAGSARVAGFDVAAHGARVRAAIGAALQEVGLDPYLTGREHLRLQMALHGIPRAARRSRAEALLARMGLEEAAGWRVDRYSAGMRRRLDLALALSHGPAILFLDEPTTGLDPQSRAALWAEVVQLARDGVTVFLTTQYLEEADALADRIGIIDCGRLVAEGTPAQLKADIGLPRAEVVLADPDSPQTAVDALSRLGRVLPSPARDAVTVRLSDPGCGLGEIAGALAAAGVHPTSIQVHPPTLEDVFLETTGLTLEGQGRRDATGLTRLGDAAG